jgi:chromosome segregation ATPase
VAAGLAQIRGKAQDVVDRCMDDPVALRRQLEQLAGQYPDRIAEVRGEIAQVEHQLAAIEYDMKVSTLAIAYATDDLGELKTKLAKAEEAVQTRFASTNVVKPQVYIRFKGVRYDLDGAYAEVIRVGNERRAQQDGLSFNVEQAKMLGEQKARLSEVLVKLEEDFGTYQAQLYTLDRQIDAIGRNERLIGMLKEQQATLESYDRYANVGSLDQIHARLAELRTTQEAQIEALRQHGVRDDYAKRARAELEQTEVNSAHEILEGIMNDLEQSEEAPASNDPSVAMLVEPIVIE